MASNASSSVDPVKEQARFNMIEQQIRPWDVLDPLVLQSLRTIHREDFVPPGRRALAFVDSEIPLPEGQVMLAPKLEARLLQELDLQATDQVLEIGTGSGHMAALLSTQAQQVTTIEIRPGLIKLAQDNLQQAGIRNVTVNQGDGLSLDGWSNRQFDAVLVSGGLPFLPDSLRALLKTGGRLIAIIGEVPIMRAMRIERRPEGFVEEGLFETLVPMLDNIPPMSRFRF